MDEAVSSHPYNEDHGVDFAELFNRLKRGLNSIVGLALLGLAVAAIAYFVYGPFQIVTTSERVVFSFPGFENGNYPDGSKFQPDDLRSSDIVAAALKQQGIEATEDDQTKVRAALTVEGIVPDNIVKERDRLRATGQVPHLYVPDEYAVTLSLPRSFPLGPRQRELLLNEIVNLYQEKFTRTYVSLPLSFGKAFESLARADYFDYDLVLNRESRNIDTFLTDMTVSARAYRSPRSNLSFSDLLKESQLFSGIRLNEVLGIIRRDGLSRNRDLEMVKMTYYLKTLNDEENKAVEEEKVIQALLTQVENRQQNYALGIKSQANPQRNDNLVVDQGLVDSLLANDAYNFLVHKALDAGLNTQRIRSEKAIVMERLKTMEAFVASNGAEKSSSLVEFNKSLDELKRSYDTLINNIRLTYQDYQQQQLGDAVRVSMQARTSSFYRGLAMAGIVGGFVGAVMGLGLTLLGIGIGAKRAA